MTPARPVAAPTPPAGRRILIVSDAWTPQVNGVVRTLATVADELRRMGHVVEVMGPDRFRDDALPHLPRHQAVAAAGPAAGAAHRRVRARPPARRDRRPARPGGADAGRRRGGAAFTSSFHTRFPEYIQARTGLPAGIAYAFLRRFHNAAAATLVATRTLRDELQARGFTRLRDWSRGVDLSRFAPEPRRDWVAEHGLSRPIFLYVGRIAVEKNIEAFLELDLPGSKVVVGGGPQLAALKARYPGRGVHRAVLGGASWPRPMPAATCSCSRRRTDTFGLVVLEALACRRAGRRLRRDGAARHPGRRRATRRRRLRRPPRGGDARRSAAIARRRARTPSASAGPPVPRPSLRRWRRSALPPARAIGTGG